MRFPAQVPSTFEKARWPARRGPWALHHARRAAPLVASLLTACLGGAVGEGGIHARLGFSEENGLRVVDVPPGSVAEQAGLRVGDRIVAIDGARVRGQSVRELARQLRGRPGSEVELEVARGDQIEALTVVRAPYQRR